MFTLPLLGAAILVAGTVHTARLVATDGLHRVAAKPRY